jgi:AhpC/TSA antioxidant enzyme
MDPRTFLPAPSVTLARGPEIGDPAPALPVALDPGRPAIVAFLRHTGCPFAEATMRMLREQAERAPAIEWLAITHSPRAATDRYCERVGGPGAVQLVSDPSRAAYAAWGLGRTTLGHFLGRRSLAGVARLARQGIRNTHPTGTRWQSAGTFALDSEHTVVWRHIPAHAGDVPNVLQAVGRIT